MKQLWTELYRPTTLKDYVFKDQQQKRKIEKWIADGVLPHILLSGSPGTGKTTLAKVLLNELGVNEFDIKEVNASKDNGVDFIRDSITRFAETMGYGEIKYVLLDESDYLSIASQSVLRNTMERYASSVRFILTCVTGDTKVYTPFGWKYIKDVSDGDNIASVGTFLENKCIVKRKSADVFRLTTEHGFSINATSNHVFFVDEKETPLSALKIGDNIPISIKHMYGAMECADVEGFFNIDDYRNFLSSNGILTTDQVNLLSSHTHLWFTKNHKLCYEYIMANNLETFSVPLLSDMVSVSRPSVRNFINKIQEKYIIGKNMRAGSVEYRLNLTLLKADVEKFIQACNFAGVHSEDLCMLHLRNVVTQENYIRQLPNFTPDVVLSLGRLVGFCEGDGHLSTTLHFAADNTDTLGRLYNDVVKLVPSCKFNISANGADSAGVCSYYNNIFLKMLLAYFGASVGNKTRQVRKLSKFANNKLFFSGFIQGFYDSDGKQFTIVNDLSVSPLHITQNIYFDEQLSFFKEISEMLYKHFDISTSCKISKCSSSTYGGSDRFMSLMSCNEGDILKYHESIGNYYDKKSTENFVGYMRYKSNQTGYRFLRYSEWCAKYIHNGLLNDVIINIEKLDGQFDVYDCSFEINHRYITNGFISHNCNYPHKIIPAIQSRTETGRMHIDRLDRDEFTLRVCNILMAENIEFDMDVIDTIVQASYPDLRRGISMMQANSYDGKLHLPESSTSVSDYKIDMIALFKAGKYKEARQVICSQATQEEYEDIFKFMYQNLDIWGDDDDKQNRCILVIRDGLVKHTSCADSELNLSATLVELEMVAKGVL